MSVIGSNILAGASGQGGYFLTKSLRFRSSASAYLNRTPSTNGSGTTFTWSGWIKRGILGGSNYMVMYSAGSGDAALGALYFGTDDKLNFINYSSGGYNWNLVSTQVFRDPSAWYHIVAVTDTTQATSSNRIKLYVNGVQITAFGTSTYPSQNFASPFFNQTSYVQFIGRWGTWNASHIYDGYLAEVNFIDGQALTPSSFGETSTSTGVWIPKKYTGTYGTNGFYLPFTDVATTSGSNAGLGKDFSGNGNYWTTNNISVTSGSTYDSMKDVPTLTDADTANYWTLNPLNTGQLGTVQSGNLEWIGGDQNNFRTVAAQILPTTGKFYWEVTPIGGGSGGAFVSGIYIGIMNYANGGTGLFASGVRIADTGKDDYVYYSDGRKVNLNSFVSYGNSYAANDVIGIAVDIDNGKIWYSKNGTWQASGDPAAGTNAAYTTVPFSTKTYAPAMSAAEITNAQKFNFGQRPFAYTPPTGFKALNTFNLPTPTIGATASTQAGKYFGINLWTGNGSTGSRAITGLGFKPDWVWWKNRTTAKWHQVFDSNRGADKALSTNATDAEDASGGYGGEGSVTSFDTDGYTLQGGAGNNENGSAIVGWAWQAGQGTNATNTAGSITSTVSANTTAGFSIVTYTGNGTGGATIGHGLGVAPTMMIFKKRNSTSSWLVWHTGYNSNQAQMLLDSTAAIYNPGNGLYFNSTYPSSTVATLGTSGSLNGSGDTYVAYMFTDVAGYSKFGSYTGNGSSDGPFVFTGFRPRYVLIKNSSTGGYSWAVYDSARDLYNIEQSVLFPDQSIAESVSSTYATDFLSNGFKLRTTNPTWNASGNTYIYMAFAESPFKYSLAR